MATRVSKRANSVKHDDRTAWRLWHTRRRGRVRCSDASGRGRECRAERQTGADPTLDTGGTGGLDHVVRAEPTEAAQNPRSAGPEAEGVGVSVHLARTASATGAREPSAY